MNHTLSASNLQFTYARRDRSTLCLEQLTLSSGLHFIVGANGSGKSTLLKILAGLLRPQTGTLLFNGRDLPIAGRGRQELAPTGYLRQDYTLRGRTSAAAFVQYGAWLHGVHANALDRRSAQLIRQAGLEEVQHKPIGRLSGGMQRRLGLAIENAHNPSLMLLDEPASGLDYHARDRLRELVADLLSRGTIVVHSSHEESELNRFDSTVHVMQAGRITKQLKASPAQNRVVLSELLEGDLHA